MPIKSSQYKGVSWDNKGGNWRVNILIDGAVKNLGNFDSELDAAEAAANAYAARAAESLAAPVPDLNFDRHKKEIKDAERYERVDAHAERYDRRYEAAATKLEGEMETRVNADKSTPDIEKAAREESYQHEATVRATMYKAMLETRIFAVTGERVQRETFRATEQQTERETREADRIAARETREQQRTINRETVRAIISEERQHRRDAIQQERELRRAATLKARDEERQRKPEMTEEQKAEQVFATGKMSARINERVAYLKDQEEKAQARAEAAIIRKRRSIFVLLFVVGIPFYFLISEAIREGKYAIAVGLVGLYVGPWIFRAYRKRKHAGDGTVTYKTRESQTED